MGELTVDNHGHTAVVQAPGPGPPPPPPAHPRRPRVREVSSRFMSPLVSSSSSESPLRNHVSAKSPIQRHNLGSTPTPNHHSDHHPRPRSSSANSRRRQLDMGGPTVDDSNPPPISEPQLQAEQVPRRQRPVKLMKENVVSRHTPLPKKIAPTPIPSRFRGTPQRSQDSDPDAHHLVTTSTKSLPELLDSGRVKAGGTRASSDSIKLAALSSSRYLNLPFGLVDGGDRLPPPVPSTCSKVGPEARKVKKVSSGLDDFGFLKLLQNRYLQWRYINGRAEASAQALERETQAKVNSLQVKMSEMYDSVAKKRTELGILRRTQALSSILEAQVPCLDQWSDLEGDYSVSLAETIQALLNASIQLPLGGNIRVDVKELQESLNSAMKVLESIVSSVEHLMPKATENESLMSELAKIVGGERTLVEESGDLLYKTQALQVDEYSLKVQIIQLQ